MDGSRLGFVLAATFASCSLALPSLEEATQTTDSGSSSYQPSQTSDSTTETLPPVTMDCDLPFRPSDQPETCIFTAGTGLCHVESRYPLSGYGIIKNAEDFDHDGRDDLVVVQTSPERLEVFRSRGDCGEYGGFETRPTLTTEIVASSVVLDANGDGFLDIFASLLVGLPTDGKILYVNDINLNFSEIYVSSFESSADAIGDMNNDMNVDIISIGYGVTIYLGDGAGAFQKLPEIAVPGLSTSAGVADFNHDGWLDIITHQLIMLNDFDESSQGFLLLGGPSMSFQDQRQFDILNTEYYLGPPAIEDFDHDGNLDFALRRGIYYGDGTGEIDEVVSAPRLGERLAALDLNYDGIVDLLSTDDILINTVDRHSWLPAGCPMPVSVVGGDFNGDGLLDLAGIVPGFNNVPDELQVFIAVAD
jgi:hypothetical protein